MVMEKQEVINLMTKSVEERTRADGKANDIPDEIVEEVINNIRHQADELHSYLYDVLKNNGVIA
jgi:hypothetical protein